MRVYVRTCPWNDERLTWAEELANRLAWQGADVQLVGDVHHDGYDTMMRAYDLQIEDAPLRGAWHLEDDVVLTTDWHSKSAGEVFAQGHRIINGFSRRKADTARGSHLKAGKLFSYNTCFWVPGSLVKPLRDYCVAWRTHPEGGGRESNVGGAYDVCIQDFLTERGEKFWQVVPSLVQHRAAPSLIGGPGRTTGRQSPSFVP